MNNLRKSFGIIHSNRIYILLSAFIIVFICIIIKLLTLTTLNALQKKHVAIVSNRAPIFDRNGIVLASNIQTFSAYINPKKIKDPDNFKQKMLKLGYKEISKNFDPEREFIWLFKKLSPDEKKRIEMAGISDINFIAEDKRILPHGNLFSHVIGHVCEDGSGMSGIEKKYNDFLINNNDGLKLTLDTRVQHYVRESLINGIKMHSAKSGAGIVVDVNTGEVLSIVSYPDFNPSNIKKSDKDKLVNWATYGAYEMGSSFKVLTIASALDSKSISEHDTIDASKPLKIGRFTINDYRGGRGSSLSVEEVLMYSSNIGAARIAQSMGKSLQYSYLQKLGLLSNMDSNVPYVASPIVGTWSDTRALTTSYGHGIAVSPLHLTSAISAVVNGGFLCKPSIIFGEHECSSRVFKKETSLVMRKLMRLAVEKGSVKKAEAKGYNVAAKSGTAEKIINGKYSKEENLVSTVAVFPIHEPQYVVLIMIDSPQKNAINNGFRTGGMVAAPVVSEIIQKIAPILNVAPTKKVIKNDAPVYPKNNYRFASSQSN